MSVFVGGLFFGSGFWNRPFFVFARQWPSIERKALSVSMLSKAYLPLPFGRFGIVDGMLWFLDLNRPKRLPEEPVDGVLYTKTTGDWP